MSTFQKQAIVNVRSEVPLHGMNSGLRSISNTNEILKIYQLQLVVAASASDLQCYSMADGRRRCFTHGSTAHSHQVSDEWEMYSKVLSLILHCSPLQAAEQEAGTWNVIAFFVNLSIINSSLVKIESTRVLSKYLYNLHAIFNRSMLCYTRYMLRRCVCVSIKQAGKVGVLSKRLNGSQKSSNLVHIG